MESITIKSKCYQGITTMIDGRTFRIPSKGKDVTLLVSVIPEHLEQLEKENKIKIVKNKKK